MSAPKLISGCGPETAEIAIVGDYPSKDEVIQNQAIVGSVARTLSILFSGNGVKLDDCYRTLFMKIEMPGFGGRNRRTAQEVLNSASKLAPFDLILKSELETIQPNVVIALGELALNALTKCTGIWNFRGSILPIRPDWLLPSHIKVIPVLHPRSLWGKYESEVYSRLDILKAIRFKQDRSPFKDTSLLWIAQTTESLWNYWSRNKKASLCTFDIETFLNTFITCISFCFDGKEAVSVPILDKSIPAAELRGLLRIIHEILASQIPKVNQNIVYDIHKLEDWHFTINNIYGDTMLAFHTLYPELPKSLAFQNSIYTDIPYYKDEGRLFNPKIHSKQQFYLYNAKDSLSAYKIWNKELEDLADLKLTNFFFQRVMPLFHVYRKIDKRGILVDDTQRLKLYDKYISIYHMHKAVLINLVGDDSFNPASSDQVGKLVYEDLKCPKHTHITETGKIAWDTDEETLEGIWINEVENAAVKMILKEVIILRKLLNILRFLSHKRELRELGYTRIHPDGRLRTHYRIEGTKSGRTSGDESLDGFLFLNSKKKLDYCEFGGSFQTIPKHGYELDGEVFGSELRSIFVPSPGYCFVEGDGSQAEARIVCIIAEDYETLAIMNKKNFKRNQFGVKDDLHTLTATWTTLKSFEQITEEDRQKKGKKPRHAGNYDMGAYRLSQMIHFAQHICAEILDRFHASAPKIRGIFHTTIRELVNSFACIQTLHDRRRDFFGRLNDKLYKEAYSYYPQAVVSDHTKFSIEPILQEHPDCFCLEEAHDGLLFEVPANEDKVEAFAKTFKTVYERELLFNTGSIIRSTPLVIPAEVKFSVESWHEKTFQEIEL